jgi:isopenicillin-N epimerase
VITNQPIAGAMITDLGAAGRVARPEPMLTPDGEPAIVDWSLNQAVRHLNHGSFGAVPRTAQRAQARLREIMDENPLAWFIGLPERVAAARCEIAGYLHSDPAHTALVPNASAGVTVVYANLPTTPGMEIVITDHCYGAVAMERSVLPAAATVWSGSPEYLSRPTPRRPPSLSWPRSRTAPR